jgi:hypothetical protein
MERISFEECLLSSDDDSVDFPGVTSISKENIWGPGHSNNKIYREPRCVTQVAVCTEANFGGQLEDPSLISASDNYSPQKFPHYSSSYPLRKNVANGTNSKNTSTDCSKKIVWGDGDGSVVTHHQHIKVRFQSTVKSSLCASKFSLRAPIRVVRDFSDVCVCARARASAPHALARARACVRWCVKVNVHV